MSSVSHFTEKNKTLPTWSRSPANAILLNITKPLRNKSNTFSPLYAAEGLDTSVGMASTDHYRITGSTPNYSAPASAYPYISSVYMSSQSPEKRYPFKSSPLYKMTMGLASIYFVIRKQRLAELASKRKLFSSSNHSSSAAQALKNNGNDDANDDYIVRLGEIFHQKYLIRSVLGKGSFGEVVEALNITTNQLVAIKIIKNRVSFSRQAEIEIRILQFLSTHDPDQARRVVLLKEYFVHKNHLCLVFELLSITLYELLKRTNFKGLPVSLIRKFAVQILTCLEFLALPDINVIHSDLKPENIMLQDPQLRSSLIKIVDFGSACFGNERAYSYIQSRFYRSPEILLGMPYDTAIDMWSLGCLLVELLTGQPLFAGSDEHDQLCRMVEMLGLPDQGMIRRASAQKLKRMFTSQPSISATDQVKYELLPHASRRTARSSKSEPSQEAARIGGKSLDFIFDEVYKKWLQFPGAPVKSPVSSAELSNLKDLIYRMLALNPEHRIRPSDALRHSFLHKGSNNDRQKDSSRCSSIGMNTVASAAPET